MGVILYISQHPYDDAATSLVSQPITDPLSLSLEEDASSFGLLLLAKRSTQLVQAPRIVTLALRHSGLFSRSSASAYEVVINPRGVSPASDSRVISSVAAPVSAAAVG